MKICKLVEVNWYLALTVMFIVRFETVIAEKLLKQFLTAAMAPSLWQSDKVCIWSHTVGCMAACVCTFNMLLVVGGAGGTGGRNQCKIAIQKSLENAELPLLPTSSPSPMSPHHNGGKMKLIMFPKPYI
uniref:Uncharacterized protein n=1 Tax=Glossina austeni TaxID=7395 RepID=A0A1A9V9D2_GLOAU